MQRLEDMTSINEYAKYITEMEKGNLHIDSDYQLDEINEKYNYITTKIADKFLKINNICKNASVILQNNYNSNFINKNFEYQELIEETLDNLVFEYLQSKELLKKGREIRYFKELKEKEVENEKRYARNALAQCGIKQ